jgi:hypothetical protein
MPKLVGISVFVIPSAFVILVSSFEGHHAFTAAAYCFATSAQFTTFHHAAM